MKPPVKVAGVKFFLDSDGKLYCSQMGDAVLFVEYWRRWQKGDFDATLYAPQVDDRGTCKLERTEENSQHTPPDLPTKCIAPGGEAVMLSAYETEFQRQSTELEALKARFAEQKALALEIVSVAQELVNIARGK